MRNTALVLMLFSAVSLSAQSARRTAVEAARTAVVDAQRVVESDPQKAAELFRRAIEADPRYFTAHEGYILAMKRWKMGAEPPQPAPRADAPKNAHGVPVYAAPKTRAVPVGGGDAAPELVAAYTAWIQQHPDAAVLHWALGYVQLGSNRAAATPELQRAIALDPKFSPAYRALAYVAQQAHDVDAQANWLKKAYEADPLDDDAAIESADVIAEADRPARLWAVADRSPKTPAAYAALIKLSNLAPTPEAKLPVFARLWQTFPEMKTYAHCWTMKAYFNLTSGTDRPTALAVAKHFDEVCVGDPDWPDLFDYQAKLNTAMDLIGRKQYGPALESLNAIKLPRYSTDGLPYYLARAEAEGVVNPQLAYEHLLPVAAKEPKDIVNAALARLGTALHKTPAQIDDDLWEALGAMAKPFADFTLTRFDNGQPLTLSSLRGKVVLVNFWFPSCGPCMREFPYIQQALDKYKDQGFEILAINIVPAEDKDVLQTAKDKKISFITLQMPDKSFALKQYKVSLAPSNFLLDRQGRFVYRPQIHDRETARTFELEIETLLRR